MYPRSNSVSSSPRGSPTDSDLEYWGISRSDLEISFCENQLGDPKYNGEYAQSDGELYEGTRSPYTPSTPLMVQAPLKHTGNTQASFQHQIYKSSGLLLHSRPNHHLPDPLNDHTRLASLTVMNPTKKTCEDLQDLQTRNDAENMIKQLVYWRMQSACLRRRLVCQRR
jgi:hypothetical protein